MQFPVRTLVAVAALIAAPLLAPAADDAKAIEFFEKKIRPVLVEHCYKCHSEDKVVGNKRYSPKGGLRLHTNADLLKGGDSGPATVPGKPGERTLVNAIKHEGEYEIPPLGQGKGKLPDDVIADFEKWIKDGAVDPRDGVSAAKASTIDIEKGRQFWSLKAPISPAIPFSRDARSSERSAT